MTTTATNVKRLAIINDQIAQLGSDTSAYKNHLRDIAHEIAATIPGDIQNAAPWNEGYNAVAKWLHRENI